MANRREALAISQELGDEELILASQMTLWRSLGGSNGPALAAQIERQLRERRDLHALNEHFFALMWAHRAWGNLERAIEYCDAGIQLASELGIPPVQYNTLKALSFIDLGRYDEAWTALEAEIGGEGHPFGRAMQTLGASVYLLDLLAYDRALVSIRDAITQAIQVQRTWMRRWGQELLILALVRSGQLDMLQLEAATSDLRAMGFALPPLIRAEVAFDEGRLEEAHSYAEAALTADDQKTHVLDRVSLLIVQARIALRLGRLEDAIQLTESALGVARRTGALPLTWRIHAVRADIFDALGVDLAASEARESAEQIVRLLAANVPDPQLRAGFLSNALAMVITQAQRV
jgi:tetratricopeptide (TPR) repeat protein